MTESGNKYPHRRKNLLTGEWVLVSPQRNQRPWQGELSPPAETALPSYDSHCYLCPGNKRANGEVNPEYTSTFVFTNDFPALVEDLPQKKKQSTGLLISENERGICRVVNFSPRHDLTLAEMNVRDIVKVIETWQREFKLLSAHPKIKHVQIFENKGSVMGNSNPHPHCQIWAQEHLPNESVKELQQFAKHYKKEKRSLLHDYLNLELALNERVVYQNEFFVAVVPFWAIWPYEIMLVPKKKMATLLSLSSEAKSAFAKAIKVVTVKYDNLFQTSFPYSAGIHQAPTDGLPHPEWHMHMHFYPPLLRSAHIKKHMVGYEMLAEPQRDLTPEAAAERLKQAATVHYKKKNNVWEDAL